MSTPCLHCGNAEHTLLWSGQEHEYPNTTDERFDFVRCANCGVVRLDPRPALSELGRIYPPEYYAYNLLSDDGDGALAFTDRLKQRVYQRRLVSAVEQLGSAGTVRLLDVGCGDGRLLDWYAQSAVGERLETHGIEMDAGAAEAARRRGHRVVRGRFEVDEELERGSFDLILAYHVIEHVDDPVAFARRAAELLAPNGIFVVATPNWDSVDARRFKGHWGGNHFPRHWTLYDKRSLGDLAASVGLELELVEYQPNPIFWVWTCHSWLKSRFPASRWPNRLFPPVGIFTPSLYTLILQSGFTILDGVLKLLTGKTANFTVNLRKRE